MGSFGGAEIAYGSDLDVLLVYEGRVLPTRRPPNRRRRHFSGCATGQRPPKGSSGSTFRSAGGRHGPLARSLDAFEEYHRRWGETWERQALLRARPVAGSDEVVERFVALADEAVWSSPLDEAAEREIRRMKARIERERIPPSDDLNSTSSSPWLTRGCGVDGTAPPAPDGHRATGTRDALDRLERAGAIGAADALSLREAYRFCGRTRNRWHLVGNYVAGAGGVSEAGRTRCHASPSSSRVCEKLGPPDRAARVVPPGDPPEPQGCRALFYGL